MLDSVLFILLSCFNIYLIEKLEKNSVEINALPLDKGSPGLIDILISPPYVFLLNISGIGLSMVSLCAILLPVYP